MTHELFISYRRADSEAIVGRIYDRLVAEFGWGAVFRDVDSIGVGDFRGRIHDALANCCLVLVVIGRSWTDICDAEGHPRLDKVDDPVRIEVVEALRLLAIGRCRIVPVLVDGAAMPRAEQVPDALRELLFQNAFRVDHDPEFHTDMDRLIEAVSAEMPRKDSLSVQAIQRLEQEAADELQHARALNTLGGYHRFLIARYPEPYFGRALELMDALHNDARNAAMETCEIDTPRAWWQLARDFPDSWAENLAERRIWQLEHDSGLSRAESLRLLLDFEPLDESSFREQLERSGRETAAEPTWFQRQRGRLLAIGAICWVLGIGAFNLGLYVFGVISICSALAALLLLVSLGIAWLWKGDGHFWATTLFWTATSIGVFGSVVVYWRLHPTRPTEPESAKTERGAPAAILTDAEQAVGGATVGA